jgi:hypothetical protein
MWLAIQRLCSKDADLSAVSTVALAPRSRACPRSILNTPRLTEATLHPRLPHASVRPTAAAHTSSPRLRIRVGTHEQTARQQTSEANNHRYPRRARLELQISKAARRVPNRADGKEKDVRAYLMCSPPHLYLTLTTSLCIIGTPEVGVRRPPRLTEL